MPHLKVSWLQIWRVSHLNVPWHHRRITKFFWISRLQSIGKDSFESFGSCFVPLIYNLLIPAFFSLGPRMPWRQWRLVSWRRSTWEKRNVRVVSICVKNSTHPPATFPTDTSANSSVTTTSRPRHTSSSSTHSKISSIRREGKCSGKISSIKVLKKNEH